MLEGLPPSHPSFDRLTARVCIALAEGAADEVQGVIQLLTDVLGISYGTDIFPAETQQQLGAGELLNVLDHLAATAAHCALGASSSGAVPLGSQHIFRLAGSLAYAPLVLSWLSPLPGEVLLQRRGLHCSQGWVWLGDWLAGWGSVQGMGETWVGGMR